MALVVAKGLTPGCEVKGEVVPPVTVANGFAVLTEEVRQEPRIRTYLREDLLCWLRRGCSRKEEQ